MSGGTGDALAEAVKCGEGAATKEEAIQKRMKNAVDELAQTELPLWDAKIVNEDKEEAYVEFRASIAENCMGK